MNERARNGTEYSRIKMNGTLHKDAKFSYAGLWEIVQP